MAIVNVYLQPEERLKFETFKAQFMGWPAKCFTYIVAKYIGYDLKDSLFLPKTSEEIAELYNKSPELAPPNLVEAYQVLCEGKIPVSPPAGQLMAINLAKFMEPRFVAYMHEKDLTRGKLGKLAIQSWFGPDLRPELEELFSQLNSYGGIPPFEEMVAAGIEPRTAALLDYPAIRAAYADWAQ